MVIRIALATTEPLAGTAAAEAGQSISFTGWLELLRVISVLVESAESPGTDTDGCERGGSSARGPVPPGVGE